MLGQRAVTNCHLDPEKHTFTCLVKGTAFRHVFHYDGLKFVLAILLVEQLAQPGGFGCIPAGAPYKVTGLDELVGDVASDVAIGTCDEHDGAGWDDWGLAVKTERHSERGNGKCQTLREVGDGVKVLRNRPFIPSSA